MYIDDDEFEEVPFKDEIEIIKGHDCGGYFWIMPIQYDPSIKDILGPWKEFRKFEISIEEDNVGRYLSYFLLKHFDKNLDANKMRDIEDIDDADTFAWYLEYNMFTYGQITDILNDINSLISILENNPTIDKIKTIFPVKSWFSYNNINLADNLLNNKCYSLNAIIKFYKDFVNVMNEMMLNCKSCDLISFMGP